jgi:hypothetical protein
LISQIKKSGLSANECIRIATQRSWAGFNADWVKQKNTEVKDNFSISKIEV